MNTQILEAINEKAKSLEIAVEWLKLGIPISFPTETVYGIGAGIFDLNAINNIYKFKGRDFKNPLSAHISEIKDVEILCIDIPDDFYLLAENFLPGPLSIVLKKNKIVSDLVTGGGSTLSIRVPDNDTFKSLYYKFGQPIAGTSANKSGRPSPTTAQFVFDDLSGIIPIILDAGKCKYQIESTVISLSNGEPELIRPGAIPQSKISQVLKKDIISRNKQIILSDETKSSLKSSRFHIECLYVIEDIKAFYENNPNKNILIMTRESSLHNKFKNVIKTDELSFFDNLREAEKNNIEIVIVHIDDYVKSSEVLLHRLKINL